jgi:hypothetical protein
MNTLIRELARRADDLARARVPDLRDIPLYTHERDLQFALLIVRECIDVVGRATASPNGYQALMKHFGVEE